jgi:L-methionine (R)-S-oxide reductase
MIHHAGHGGREDRPPLRFVVFAHFAVESLVHGPGSGPAVGGAGSPGGSGRAHTLTDRPVGSTVSGVTKAEQYREVREHLRSLLEGEADEVAIMATTVCELHQRLDHFDWTGFYRVVAPGLLKIGPYQGSHGCLTIPFDRGVCGRCAREARTQIVPDVTQVPYHIACAGPTRSEIVVPVLDSRGRVRAVLDVDSDALAAFDTTDAQCLEEICGWLTPSLRT